MAARSILLDEDEVARERHSRLDIPKAELVRMLEVCEAQNTRFKEYLADYERIQREDRKRINQLTTESADLCRQIEELESSRVPKAELKHACLNLVQSLLQLVAILPEDQRTRPAMTAIRRIEHQMYRALTVQDWYTSDAYAAVSFWQLCKWACYMPRPGSNAYEVYDAGANYLPEYMIGEILERTRL